MAVPSVVRQRMDQEADALRQQGIDPNGPPPGVASVAPVASVPSSLPTPQPTTPTDDAAALRARNAELEQELRTQNGRVSAQATELQELKQRFDVINGNRAFLETSITEQAARSQELERKLQELQAQGVTQQVQSVVGSLDEGGPTEEQKKEFGDSLDFVQRVVRQQLASVVKPLIAKLADMEKRLDRVKEIDSRLPHIEESVKVTDMQMARSREEQFIRAEVLPHFPDFETVRNTKEWKEYLSRDTGRGYQVGQLLKTYRQANDAQGIRAVIGGFYEQRKSKPSLDSLAVPGKSAADAPETPAPAKMKASEYQANLRAFTSKRLSKQDWDAYRARFEQALNAGNVEMDAELR